MSYFAKYYLTGPDAQKAVDWIFTNNMAKPPGMLYICGVTLHRRRRHRHRHRLYLYMVTKHQAL